MTRLGRLTALTATLALLGAMAGCGTGAPGASELSLRSVTGARAGTKAAGKAAGKSAATAKAPVAAAIPPAAAGAGTLRVAFASLGAARSLMALDDVASVRVTLTAAGGATQVQTLDRAALTAASPAVAFAGVPVGQATLLVEVLDAAGNVIGQSQASAAVVARQTVEVGLTVRLAATGNVAATVAIVEDATVTPAATPTPAPTAAPTATPAPSASPSLPSFLASTAPTAAPSATPSLPSFLASTMPTAVPTATYGATREVWGRLYDYAGTQITSGSVRYTSTDVGVPFDVTADLRADGYYYVPGVPTGVTVQVSATAGNLGVTAWYIFSEDNQTSYDWLDLFVSAI